MAEEASNEHTPPAFSFTDEASPSTKRYNTQSTSSHLGAYTTTGIHHTGIHTAMQNHNSISDDAWRYQWNNQHRPITDRTYNVDDFQRLPVLANGTRNTTQLMAHPASPGTKKTLKTEAPDSHCWSAAAEFYCNQRKETGRVVWYL
ncbi:uncharacterized protein [Dermacentor albipictus]|uniref:uncharacterized protein n=1 Tax=Dermacentor albipictus TaxID=60249 RepID=UPI0038FCBCF4